MGSGVVNGTGPSGSGLLAAAGPWRGLDAAPRRAGWRALEIECDGAHVTLRVDGEVVAAGLPPANLSAIVLFAGHVADSASAEPAPAYWSTVFAARRAPASAPTNVTLGAEVSEVWAGVGAAWIKVTTSGNAPEPARGAAAAELAGALYVWGGIPAKTVAAGSGGAVHRLDITANPPAWSRVDPVGGASPGTRANHVVAALDADGGGGGTTGAVLVHGGRGRGGGEILGDVWTFTPSDAAWELLFSSGGGDGSSYPLLHSHSGAARGGALYVFGGAGVDGEASAATWRFLLKTRTWTELTAAQPAGARPCARVGAAAAAGTGGEGKFYIAGGAGDGGVRMADAWMFDGGTERWAPAAPAPTVNGGGGGGGGLTVNGPPAHSRAAMAVTPGALFLFGGEGNDSNQGILWRLPTF